MPDSSTQASPPASRIELTVVVPTFNERENVAKLIAKFVFNFFKIVVGLNVGQGLIIGKADSDIGNIIVWNHRRHSQINFWIQIHFFCGLPLQLVDSLIEQIHIELVTHGINMTRLALTQNVSGASELKIILGNANSTSKRGPFGAP